MCDSFGKMCDSFGKKPPKCVTALVKMPCNLVKYLSVFSSKDILKIYLRGEASF
jgi:hypothetical protein